MDHSLRSVMHFNKGGFDKCLGFSRPPFVQRQACVWFGERVPRKDEKCSVGAVAGWLRGNR